jgi:hypothetical protein
MKLMIDYAPQKIVGFYCYIHEWINELMFCLPLRDHINDWQSYEAAVK